MSATNSPSSHGSPGPNLKRFKRAAKQRGTKSNVLPGVNLTRLSEATGINRSHLSRIVNGSNKAGMDVLGRLRNVLGFESVEQVELWLSKLNSK